MSLTSFFTIVCFEIDVLVCILFPVQFSKIMCTSAVLIYITKYFPSCKPLFLKKLKKEKKIHSAPSSLLKSSLRQNLFLTLKMICAINFTVCYSCRSISINPKFPKPLNNSFIYTYILLKKSFFSMTKVTNFIHFLVK